MADAKCSDRVLILYWGRRGAGSKILLDLAVAAKQRPAGDIFFSFARDNELAAALRDATRDAFIVKTFGHGLALALSPLRLPIALLSLIRYCRKHDIRTVVNLMPHLWTGIAAVVARLAGIRWFSIVHEIHGHPGDRTGRVTALLRLELRTADRLVPLSNHVRQVLTARVDGARVVETVPLYALNYGDECPPIAQAEGRAPVRFLFFGRIAKYKGLERFVSACETLVAEGYRPSVGVIGEGSLGALEPRLRGLGAVIENRWVDHDEIGPLIRQFDVVVAPAIEASQSGVVAAAHGCGVPVIVTPVGGLVEQVQNGVNGLVSRDTSVAAIADSMRQVMDNPQRLEALRLGIGRTADRKRPAQFLDALLAQVLPETVGRG